MNTIYLPDVVGGGYREFWHCRKRYRVVKGGKGSKKSSTAALWYIYHMMKLPESNLLVVRQVYRTHRDSTFAQLKWAIGRLGVERYWQALEYPLELRYRPTGQRILFRGFDDADKLASTTVSSGYLCWVWIEEAFEIRSEDAFDRLDLSAPRGEVPPPLFKQTTLTFNPWSAEHWLRGRFFESQRPEVLAMTTTYRCNEFLDQADLAVFEEMKRRQPQRYAVAGMGQWGVCEGLIYTDWRIEPFDIEEVKRDGGLQQVFGLDYGYSNDPTTFIAAAVDTVGRRIYLYDEHYEKKMLNSDIAAMLRRKGYAKERIRADAAEPKSNEDLRRKGILRLTAARKGPDSVINGIARIQEFSLLVHPRCVHTAAELSSYVWKKRGDGTSMNYPEDDNNHLMDALRYAMEGVRPGGEGRRGAVQIFTFVDAGIYSDDVRGGWS